MARTIRVNAGGDKRGDTSNFWLTSAFPHSRKTFPKELKPRPVSPISKQHGRACVPKRILSKMSSIHMTPALAKSISHEFLRRHCIEVNETLPLLEPVEVLQPQGARSVAIRCIVLSHVIGIGFGADIGRLKASLEEFALFEYASAREQGLLSRSEHSQQEKVNATWLIECVQSLAWCLGLVELDPFRRCDDNLASHFPRPFADPRRFISEATLRPLNEIYQQVDLHYRLHWAARNARLMKRPSTVEEGMISERRKALEWVIGPEQDWDEIPLDT